MNRTYTAFALGASALLIAACGGGSDRDHDDKPQADASATPAASVDPTGKVIKIQMSSDEKGNFFSPSDIEARRGDVLQFVLKTGVHNVHFLPDSNPGKAGLPAASDFLQLPGQTWDYLVALAPGKYQFQCDPHAALGMMAKLEVEDEKH